MRTDLFNKKYSKISSLNDLQAEMDKLDYRLELKEREIWQDINGIQNMFSLSYLTSAIIGRSRISSITSGMKAGFSFVTSLFKRKKKKAKHHERPVCHNEEENYDNFVDE